MKITEKELEEYGKEIAEIFMIQKAPGYKAIYETAWGHKSNIGIANCVLEMAERIKKKQHINV